MVRIFMSNNDTLLTISAEAPVKVILADESTFADFLSCASDYERQWLMAHGFTAKPETSIAVPHPTGEIAYIVSGVKFPLHCWSIAHLPAQIPAGHYYIETEITPDTLESLAIGFMLAQYQFSRYKKSETKRCCLVLADAQIREKILATVDAICLVRDLINTPTNDMGPSELARTAIDIAKTIDATCHIIEDAALIEQNYPAIHAVGRAATNRPCLIDIRWGNPAHPKVTLVGKGVCFDTGGLDIKPYSSMKLMKKDMGGAALMLGLAQLIAVKQLPVSLRVLIPAVENAIAGNAYRPQDVLTTRKGLTVEIGSTDAEGRVILADALAEADSECPDLLIDAATLTGAARTALGTELPALFASDKNAGLALMERSLNIHDPLWQLPLWEPYDRYVKSPIADITNSPGYAYAGAITAALFLQRFVSSNTRLWLHIDTMAWNIDAQPGRPVGGEALGLRALFSYIESRYCKY